MKKIIEFVVENLIATIIVIVFIIGSVMNIPFVEYLSEQYPGTFRSFAMDYLGFEFILCLLIILVFLILVMFGVFD